MGRMKGTSLVLPAVKVLVTGGAGFIGSNLVRALLARGDEVRVLDNFSTGQRANLADLDAVEVFEGDLRSYERVHNAVRGVEAVYHQGALPSVPRSLQDPLTTSAVNIDGTLNVLLAARDEGVRRVVTASSSSVYGSSGPLPRKEDAPVDPIAPYAVAKLAAERYCVSFARVYESIETVCLRYFNIFGPHQDPRSQYAAVIPLFITMIADGRPVPVNGDGEQSRDFTFVENVVAANIAAVDAPADAVNGRVFNIATGQPTSVNDVAEMIGEILDRPVEREHLPPRAGDVRDSWADVTAAREVLGWEPAVSMRDGLRQTVEHFQGVAAVVAE
jgi:UDP-glucose 4-epimerase